jgi:hypothetical protein
VEIASKLLVISTLFVFLGFMKSIINVYLTKLKILIMKKIIILGLFAFGFTAAQASTQREKLPLCICQSDTILTAYVGVYKLDENGMIDTYTVTFEDNKLYGQANGYDRTELTKQTDPHAFKSGYGSDVIFSQEVPGKPFNKVKLMVQGSTVMGTRE